MLTGGGSQILLKRVDVIYGWSLDERRRGVLFISLSNALRLSVSKPLRLSYMTNVTSN